MRSSVYNIFLQDTDGNTLVFNSYTKRFFRFSQKNTPRLRAVIDDIDSYRHISEYSEVCNTLHSNGFVVDDNRDEYLELRSSFERFRDSSAYMLLVYTTYACNLSCWYCVQRHNGTTLSQATEGKVKAHIRQYIPANNITSLNLSWFGGEPLLNYGSIRRLSEYAGRYCNENGIDFRCSITTNGTLLTRQMAEDMAKMSFKSFQITIDGNKERHNATRHNASANDSFSLILNNIKVLCDSVPDAEVLLRINYTNDNTDESLTGQIDNELGLYRKKIRVMFRKVWQEEFSEDLEHRIGLIMASMVRLGYDVVHEYDCPTPCYVEKRNYLAIFPDGSTDRCSNIDMSAARGELMDNGSIHWHDCPTECDTNAFSAGSECQECRYLPLCLGPCPKARMRIENKGKIHCQYNDKDRVFEAGIKNYILMKEAAL